MGEGGIGCGVTHVHLGSNSTLDVQTKSYKHVRSRKTKKSEFKTASMQ